MPNPVLARWSSAALCSAALWAGAALAQQKRPLAIVNAALLEAEDGFAIRSDKVYMPGESVYLAFQIQGYMVDRNSHVKLSYNINALDFKGIPFVEPEQGNIDTEVSPQDAKWLPRIRFSAAVPPFADSGNYKLALHVTDELAKTETSQELQFSLRGRNVPPSSTLVVHNFAFSRKEDGEPLPVAAYRRGDTLWTSFDITGYAGGEKNSLWVEYGLAVINPQDQKVFEQPQAAEEKGTSFYPRRYVHAGFTLNLEGGLPAGPYTIHLTVRDRIGGQAHESRHNFTVE